LVCLDKWTFAVSRLPLLPDPTAGPVRAAHPRDHLWQRHPVEVVGTDGVAASPFAADWRASNLIENPHGQEAHAVTSPRSNAVPKHMQAIYDAVIALTDAFCREHLTGEYRDLAHAGHGRVPITQPPQPTGLGTAAHRGCGIIHVLGPTHLPVGQGDPALLDHGGGLHRVWRRPRPAPRIRSSRTR
jgi:hypothetical protein